MTLRKLTSPNTLDTYNPSVLIKTIDMKILHTADWHLGVNLYNESLEEDHHLFLEWLIKTCIPEHQPDVIIISGDVFDKANPSTNARRQYYRFLSQLLHLGIKEVIITAGNHDSPSMLEAPRELLHQLNIHVIGTPTENIEEMLIPIVDTADGKTNVVIAAVPFVRDQDVRFSQTGDNQDMREDALRKGIYNYFEAIAKAAEPYRLNKVPVICMAHLFASGVTLSDSERPVQIGNLADVGADCFPKEHFDYVALGHIHGMQNVEGNNYIWYSGSPIALSFSEWKQMKYLRLVTIESSKLQSIEIEIPHFRKLLRIDGDFLSVKAKVKNLTRKEVLPSLLEITILEEHYNPLLGREVAQWIEEVTRLEKEQFKIASYRYHFSNAPKKLSSLTSSQSVAELKPEEVFINKLDNAAISNVEERELILESFYKILAETQTEEQE